MGTNRVKKVMETERALAGKDRSGYLGREAERSYLTSRKAQGIQRDAGEWHLKGGRYTAEEFQPLRQPR